MKIITMKYAFCAGIITTSLFSVAVLAQTVPPLGEAEGFAVLAASTVTNTGSTAVTGELGVSPGTAITGFPPGVVVEGQIRSNDGLASQAQQDLLIAYNHLAGQAVDVEQAAALGGGMVLIPGVYHFSDAADLTGSLVLDAQGDSTAVFVFQVEEALTVANDAQLSLINGASASNVFWQVGTSATFGTSSRFMGSILAGAGITFNTGATLTGRALAQTAVTMDTNAIVLSTAPTGEGDPPAVEGELPVLSGSTGADGSSSSAVFRIGATLNQSATFQNEFTTDDHIVIAAEVLPEVGDLNEALELYIVARVVHAGNEQWLYKNESGQIIAWDQDERTLAPAYGVASAGASIKGLVYSGTLEAGVYEVYIGYSAADGALIYTGTPFRITVAD